MTAPRGYLVVEGHGEVHAALNLVTRLWADLRLRPMHWNDPPIRGSALHTDAGLTQAAELVRRKSNVRALLLLRDADDECPKETGPRAAERLVALDLPFPSAIVMLRREFETLFLPSMHRMAGVPLIDPRGVTRPGLKAGARFDADPESVRDAKGELSAAYERGRRYKPSLDQLALTRLVDFSDVRAAAVPAFGTLERALSFLALHDEPRAVYPFPR